MRIDVLDAPSQSSGLGLAANGTAFDTPVCPRREPIVSRHQSAWLGWGRRHFPAFDQRHPATHQHRASSGPSTDRIVPFLSNEEVAAVLPQTSSVTSYCYRVVRSGWSLRVQKAGPLNSRRRSGNRARRTDLHAGRRWLGPWLWSLRGRTTFRPVSQAETSRRLAATLGLHQRDPGASSGCR